MTAYDDALREIAAAEGWEYVDCRVQPGWESDRPVRHERLRVVGRQPQHEVGASGPVLGDVTAGAGLGDDVPAPALPILLRSPYEQLMLEPRHRKAAARGREIHERAEALAEKAGIPYEEAIKVVLSDAG